MLPSRIRGSPIHHCLFPSSDFRKCAHLVLYAGVGATLMDQRPDFSLGASLAIGDSL
jgi:hypothetical protein